MVPNDTIKFQPSNKGLCLCPSRQFECWVQMIIRACECGLYEIDDCTAFGPCSTRGITPARLLVCGEQISRQRGETAREPQLPDNSRDPGNYKLNTASAPTTACFVTGQHYPMYPGTPHNVLKPVPQHPLEPELDLKRGLWNRYFPGGHAMSMRSIDPGRRVQGGPGGRNSPPGGVWGEAPGASDNFHL